MADVDGGGGEDDGVDGDEGSLDGHGGHASCCYCGGTCLLLVFDDMCVVGAFADKLLKMASSSKHSGVFLHAHFTLIK